MVVLELGTERRMKINLAAAVKAVAISSDEETLATATGKMVDRHVDR